MKAAILYAPEDLVYGQSSDPKPDRNNLIVKVQSATVCGTDIRIFKGQKPKVLIIPQYSATNSQAKLCIVTWRGAFPSAIEWLCAPLSPVGSVSFAKLARKTFAPMDRHSATN